MSRKKEPAPAPPGTGPKVSSHTNHIQHNPRCAIRGCTWRGRCPVHSGDDQPSRAIDSIVRQRPHTLSRGGGWQVRCSCGAWVNPRTTRQHTFCEVA